MDINTAYKQNTIIFDHFLDEEFETSNYKKTYFDIGNINELWEWIDGPFYNGFYNENIVIKYNQPVGGLFIRQSRIKKEKCNFIDNNSYCYFKYNDKNKYEGNYLNTKCKLDIYPKLYGKDEHNQYYGKDGCVLYLPFNKTNTKIKLEYLKKNNWIDESTRALSIYFNLYNSNTQLLTNVRFLIEFFDSGYEEPFFRIISMPFNPQKNNIPIYIIGSFFQFN